MIKSYKLKGSNILVLTDTDIKDLDTLYDYDLVQLSKKKSKLSKQEYDKFMDTYWNQIKEKYKVVIVIGSELFKFITKVSKAGNYYTEIYTKDNVKIIQGIKYQGSWLDKNKYLYQITLDTLDRVLNNKEPVRIWEFINKDKIKGV